MSKQTCQHVAIFSARFKTNIHSFYRLTIEDNQLNTIFTSRPQLSQEELQDGEEERKSYKFVMTWV